MPALGFARSSTPGHLPGEGDGRQINCYPEKSGDGWIYRRVAGLVAGTNTGLSGPRGAIDVGGVVYAAFSGSVAKFIPGGAATTLSGDLSGSDGVTFARNNRAGGPDLVAVRSSGGAYVVSSTTVSTFPDSDLPANANSAAPLDGYILFTVPDGRIFATDLNGLGVNALSFATAEAKPDGLIRGISSGDTFFAMGTSSIEPWKDIGAQPFPLARVPSVIPVGLLAPMAVAGFEDGWDQSPLFVSHRGTVEMLSGYDAKTVSTPDVERFIADSDVGSLEASVHTVRGHAFWTLSSNVGTWEYEVLANAWHERVSYGLSRWRGTRSVKSNGAWLVFDTLSGYALTVSEATRTEFGNALTWVIESACFKDFPARTSLAALFADFALLAADVASNPTVTIEWSHDGGVTWSPGVSRPLAARPVRVNRLGLMSDGGLRVRFTVSAGSDFSFSGAAISTPDVRAP